MNGQSIKFKSRISNLILGIIMIILAIHLEVVLIAGFSQEGRDGIVAIVILSIFFTGVMALLGILAVAAYFSKGKNIRNALKQYGKENIVANINASTIKLYQNILPASKVYFTDKFIIDPSEVIIEYKQIGMMYKMVTRYQRMSIASVAFALLDGKTYYLCSNISDEEIMNVMQLCYKFNKRILFGNSDENQIHYRQNVRNYSSGNTVEAVSQEINVNGKSKDVSSQPPYAPPVMPYEWTAKGQKRRSGEAMLFIGGIFLVSSLVFGILMPMELNKDLDSQVNAVSAEERAELLAWGCTEYKTVGRHFYDVSNSSIEDVKNGQGFKELYVFELEGDSKECLGVNARTTKDWYKTASGMSRGLHIFYYGETVGKTIKGEDSSYEVMVIEAENIVATYGLPSEKYESERKMNWMVVAVTSVPMAIIGVVFVIIGMRWIRKYRTKRN